MNEAIADTSIFVARETGRPIRAEAVPDRIGVSFITIGELRAGVLAAPDLDTRDRRLRTLLVALSLEPIPVDDRVADAWARLRTELDRRGLRMLANDGWIAATAMSRGVPVVTQDAGFVEVPGLEVIRV